MNWIREKLGIPALERQAEAMRRQVQRIENRLRLGRGPLALRQLVAKPAGPERYDEIERRKKRQRKGAR